jgi:hypothetical protein
MSKNLSSSIQISTTEVENLVKFEKIVMSSVTSSPKHHTASEEIRLNYFYYVTSISICCLFLMFSSIDEKFHSDRSCGFLNSDEQQ